MTTEPSGFHHDAAVLLRYRWFVLAVIAIAIATALLIGLTRTTAYNAQSTVELRPSERQPVAGIRPTIVLNDYMVLGRSSAVAERAIRLLSEKGIQTDVPSLLAATSEADVTSFELRPYNIRQIQFTATHGDRELALAYADAWAQAYIQEAIAYTSGLVERQVELLQQQAKAAAADMDRAHQMLTDFLRSHPEATPVSLAALLEERGQVVRALARLKTIQAQGGASPNELHIALADMLPRDTALPAADLTTLNNGLSLRLNALEAEIAAFQGSNSTADQAFQLLRAAEAATTAYNSVLVQIPAARAIQPVPPVDFSVLNSAVVNTTRQLGLLGLLAAAAALGLAVGVVGAFVLEFLTRNRLLPWLQDRRTVTERP